MTNINLPQFIGNKIKTYRIENKFTQEELAKKIGTTKATISNYETGYRTPKQDSLFELAKVLNISINDLFPSIESNSLDITTIYNQLDQHRQQKVFGYAKQQLKDQQTKQNKPVILANYRNKRKEDLKSINWLGAASAGTGEFLVESAQREEIELPAEQIPEGADFCLSVNGNSMEPVFMDDSYIFIEEVSEISNGSIAVVVVNNEAFLKRIHFTNNHAILESFNTEYDEIIVTEDDEFRIIGRVIF